jgi:hypothetical protein
LATVRREPGGAVVVLARAMNTVKVVAAVPNETMRYIPGRLA